MSNINDEMIATADFAIQSAKDRFKQELDFSEESISILVDILGQIYWGFSNYPKREGKDGVIYRTAFIWGGYLGEFMRLRWGGDWIRKGADTLVSIKNIEFSPINFVYQKITSQPQSSLKNYLIETEKRIRTSVSNPKQPQKPPEAIISQPKKQIPAKPSEKPVSVNRRLLFSLAGIGGLLLVIFVCAIGYKLIATGGVPAVASVPSETSTNTPILLEQTLVTEASPTHTPTDTPSPTWTPLPTMTSRPSLTPSSTSTETATWTPTETQTPVPTPTRKPTKTSTPVTPTDTSIPATQIPTATRTPQPSPTATKPAPIVIQSCEVNPSTVPAGINTTLTFTAHFSGPGQGFDTQFQANFPGQSGCSASDTSGNGVASCNGSSGLLPSSTKVNVVFKSTAGDCTASYSSP